MTNYYLNFDRAASEHLLELSRKSSFPLLISHIFFTLNFDRKWIGWEVYVRWLLWAHAHTPTHSVHSTFSFLSPLLFLSQFDECTNLLGKSWNWQRRCVATFLPHSNVAFSRNIMSKRSLYEQQTSFSDTPKFVMKNWRRKDWDVVFFVRLYEEKFVFLLFLLAYMC